MFFSRRHRSGPDRFLPAKLATLVVGGVLGLIGMRTDNALLVSVAAAVVLLGFLLRFIRDPGMDGEAPEPRSPDPGPR